MFPEPSLTDTSDQSPRHQSAARELAMLRREIDRLDEEIVLRIAQRNQMTLRILDLKHDGGMPSYSPDRESRIFARVRKLAASRSISDNTIAGIYQLILRQFVSPYD